MCVEVATQDDLSPDYRGLSDGLQECAFWGFLVRRDPTRVILTGLSGEKSWNQCLIPTA